MDDDRSTGGPADGAGGPCQRSWIAFSKLLPRRLSPAEALHGPALSCPIACVTFLHA